MKNTFGNSISVTLFGESHGPEIGVVIDGLAPDITVDEDHIALDLAKRRPSTAMDTSRREPDRFRIVSGVFSGKTTGTPSLFLSPTKIKFLFPTKNITASPAPLTPTIPPMTSFTVLKTTVAVGIFRDGLPLPL